MHVPNDVVRQKSDVLITEHGVEDTHSSNMPNNFDPSIDKDPINLGKGFDLSRFKEQITISRLKEYESEDGKEIQFFLKGLEPGFVNALRRIILVDLPSMAIDKVLMYQNTSVLSDGILCHRLGLIPFEANPDDFEFRSDPSSIELKENEGVKFKLQVKCSWKLKKEDRKNLSNSTPVDDAFKDSNIYSSHFKWVPIGKQNEKFKEKDVGPIDGDILLNKLRPGQEIDCEVLVVKGIGKDHAKFSPVGTVYYRMLPDIKLLRPILNDDAETVKKSFSKGVIGIKKNIQGDKEAFVIDASLDRCSREIFKDKSLSNAVEYTRRRYEVIFSIESVGPKKSAELFVDSLNFLINKCNNMLNVIKKKKEFRSHKSDVMHEDDK